MECINSLPGPDRSGRGSLLRIGRDRLLRSLVMTGRGVSIARPFKAGKNKHRWIPEGVHALCLLILFSLSKKVSKKDLDWQNPREIPPILQVVRGMIGMRDRVFNPRLTPVEYSCRNSTGQESRGNSNSSIKSSFPRKLMNSPGLEPGERKSSLYNRGFNPVGNFIVLLNRMHYYYHGK